MALISCPECKSEVSDTAYKCPKCGITIKKPRRGFFGRLYMGLFVLFNIIMAIWLFYYWGGMGKVIALEGQSDAYQAGTALGATIGTGIIFAFWALGDIILGMLVLLTRPKS